MDGDDETACDFTLHGLPAKVRERLVIQAEARGMSLNSYIVEQLTLDAATPTVAEWMADLPSMAEWIAGLDALRAPIGATGDDVSWDCSSSRAKRSGVLLAPSERRCEAIELIR